MKRFRVHSLLPQYILLYILMVFTPAVIFCFSLLQSNHALEREVNKTNRASVVLIQKSLDDTFVEIDALLAQLGTNSAFSRYTAATTPELTTEALNTIIDSHSYLKDIVISPQGSDYLYSTNGRLSDENLGYLTYMQELKEAGLSTEQWEQDLRNAEKRGFWFDARVPQPSYLYLFSPIYYSVFQYPDIPAVRNAALVIRRDFITDLFRVSCLTDSDNLLLLDEDLNLLSAYSANGDQESLQMVSRFLKDNPEVLNNSLTELKDHGLLLYASKSETTGLSYVRFLPKAVAYEALNSQQGYTIIMAILAFLVALVLISLTLEQNYIPIRKLASWVRNQQPEKNWGGTKNELSLFQKALDDAYTENEELSQTVHLSRYGMIDHLLGNLISGNFASQEEFISACEKLNVQLCKPYYAVCSILIEEGDELPDFAELVDTIHADLPDNFCVAAKNMLFERKVVLVIGCDEKDYDLYTVLITDIKNRLLVQNSLLTSLGMGSFYDSYELVGKSYLDSINALDYRLVYGKDCLITPDIYNRNAPSLSDSYPSADLELLDASLMSHNIETVTTVIHRINANIKLKNYSLHTAKYICYDIFSIFRKDADYSDLGNGRTIPQTLDITKLTSYGTVDEFFSTMLEMIETKFSDNALSETAQQANIGAKLLEYADAHCLSYDFQAKNMAEHFGISPQYMRKLFKNHTGMSVSEYVADKRLEKSMNLLVQTDMNLQDIVVQIGNSDISGFVRFFKQKTGMTPGQYRKANREQN